MHRLGVCLVDEPCAGWGVGRPCRGGGPSPAFNNRKLRCARCGHMHGGPYSEARAARGEAAHILPVEVDPVGLQSQSLPRTIAWHSFRIRSLPDGWARRSASRSRRALRRRRDVPPRRRRTRTVALPGVCNGTPRIPARHFGLLNFASRCGQLLELAHAHVSLRGRMTPMTSPITAQPTPKC